MENEARLVLCDTWQVLLVLLTRFWVLDGMLNYSFDISDRQCITIFEINTSCSGLYFWMFSLEWFNVMVATSVQGNIVFLICQRYPSPANLVRWHFVTHIDSSRWIELDN